MKILDRLPNLTIRTSLRSGDRYTAVHRNPCWFGRAPLLRLWLIK